MLFTATAHAGLADGSITRTYRHWKRPQVKVDGRYRVGPVVLVVDALDRLDQSSSRRLKRLGLTISLERGYRISPRGQAVLDRLA